MLVRRHRRRVSRPEQPRGLQPAAGLAHRVLLDEVHRGLREVVRTTRLPLQLLPVLGGGNVLASGALVLQLGRQPSRRGQRQRGADDRLAVQFLTGQIGKRAERELSPACR